MRTVEYLMIGVLGMFVVLVFFVAIPKEVGRSNKADQLAEPGCVSLGHPRDLNTVYFYDCDGEIKMKRVK